MESKRIRSIVFKFGLMAAALILLIRISKYTLTTRHLNLELIIILFSLLFVIAGFMIARITRYKNIERQREMDLAQVSKLGISGRELEVLHEMAQGKSNLEIADTLFISESTVKTHVSNLLIKLQANRRTEAIKKAHEFNLL